MSKFKEISYKLENKVVELTQTLQTRTAEKKELQAQLSELEQQLQQWINRHEESDMRAKQFHASLQAAEAELGRRNELLQAKTDVEKRLEEVIAKAAEKEAVIHKLTDDLIRQASQLEAQQRALEAAPVRNQDDNSVIMTLKNEVSSLREQLNRSNALNVLTRGARPEPPLSPTFAPALRPGEANGSANTNTPINRHQRRHSSAGVYALGPSDNRTSTDEIMFDIKKNQAMNPRAVSVAYNGEDNFRLRNTNGLPDIRDFDDPAEEKIRLMQDVKRLDEDVLDGLVRGLKIPAPSLTNPSAVKEILFPANLISLVTNEMWKYGLIPESERFLANVMQTIQTHVMVRFYLPSLFPADVSRSHSMARKRLFQEFSGCRTSMRCCRSFALRKVTCCKASGQVKRMPCGHSTGTIMSDLCLLSNTTLTASNITSIIRGCWKPRRSCLGWSSLL